MERDRQEQGASHGSDANTDVLSRGLGTRYETTAQMKFVASIALAIFAGFLLGAHCLPEPSVDSTDVCCQCTGCKSGSAQCAMKPLEDCAAFCSTVDQCNTTPLEGQRCSIDGSGLCH
jgi:hypothetical protein